VIAVDRTMRIFDRIDEAFFFLAKIGVFLMMLLTTIDSLGRYFFHHPIAGAYEFSEKYLMVAIVYLSISYVMKLDGHIRVDIVIEKFPVKIQNALNSIYYLLGAGLMFVIGYQGMLATLEAWENNYVGAGVIAWPTWASVIFVPIGTYMFALRLIFMCISNIINIMKPTDKTIIKQVNANDLTNIDS
jgi:TRAP-type C4-dicarboxylate transport system permease small subunit